MFQNRIKLLLVLFALPVLAVVGRLAQFQVCDADDYLADTEDMLKTEPRQLPFLRGSITDRNGILLAYDAPVWEIAVQYAAMIEDDPNNSAVQALRKRMCRATGVPYRELTQQQIDESWRRICQIAERTWAEIEPDCKQTVARVQHIKARVAQRWGIEKLIQEELQSHAVVTNLDQSQQVAARVALAEYPWVEVIASHRRKYEGGTAIGHILGQIGRVTEAAINNDPNADEPLAKYVADDYFGVRGVEALGEQWLRGQRGEFHQDRKGNIRETPAVNGRDIRLSIDLRMQQFMYAQLGREIIARTPNSTGGCAVLLDIPTRQIIAMASWPSVDPNNQAEILAARNDLTHKPFLFRAVREHYAPGSIVKPVILAGALSRGLIGPHEPITCNHCLLPNHPDRWRCTGTHGPTDAITALQHSCNVFFYTLGERMGVDSEAYWMRQFGMGQLSGTGLLDELRGRLPRTHNTGQARLAAIGQGEVELTPVQAANMVATIASGVYKPVTLWPDNPNQRQPSTVLPVNPSAWRIIREGLYRAVNREGGTAYRTARLQNAGEYVLLGKTGSAEVRKDHPTYSLFIGYLTRRGRYLENVTDDAGCVAIAVIIEYGGHGGEVAAPIAATMLDGYLMEHARRSTAQQAKTPAAPLMNTSALAAGGWEGRP